MKLRPESFSRAAPILFSQGDGYSMIEGRDHIEGNYLPSAGLELVSQTFSHFKECPRRATELISPKFSWHRIMAPYRGTVSWHRIVAALVSC